MYYYHVVIKTKSNPDHEERQVNLESEGVYKQFVEPYEEGSPIFIDGIVVEIDDIQRIKVLGSENKQTSTHFPEIESERSYYIYGLKDVTPQFFTKAPSSKKSKFNETATKQNIKSDKIFVVHGHDNEMKEAVARVLEKFHLQPIILQETLDEGKAIIEKLEKNSEHVSYAVVLLSPDDKGYEKDQDP